MAIHVAGLDLGTRSIKLIGLDTSGRPRIEAFDTEELPLGGADYLSEPTAADTTSPPEDDEASSEGPREDGAAGPDPSEGDSTESAPSATRDAEPAGDDLRSWQRALEQLLDRHEFREDTVFVTYLPEGRALSIHQDVPFPEPEKVERVLPDLLEDRLPLDPDDIVYDFEVFEDGDDDDHTAVVGVGRKPALREFLDALGECRIDPAVLGIPELMLRYAAEAACPIETETAAVLDLGHGHTRLLVLHDGDPVLAQSIQKGGAQVIRSIADQFDLDPQAAERHLREQGRLVESTAASPDQRAVSDATSAALDPLIRELRRHFQSLYASAGVEIDRIYICGGLSLVDEIDRYIHQQLDVPTQPLPLERAVDTGPVMPQRLPLATLPVALALQQPRDRSGDRLLNLRTGEFAYRGHSGYLRSHLLKIAASVALIFALVCGALFARKIQLDARHRATRSAIEKQTRELFGEPAFTTSEIQEKVAAGPGSTRSFVPRMSAYQLLHELMSSIPDDLEVTLDRLDVDTDRNIVQVSGTTKGPQMVDQLVGAFEDVKCLTNINKKPVKVRNDQETQFQLEITSGCS